MADTAQVDFKPSRALGASIDRVSHVFRAVLVPSPLIVGILQHATKLFMNAYGLNPVPLQLRPVLAAFVGSKDAKEVIGGDTCTTSLGADRHERTFSHPKRLCLRIPFRPSSVDISIKPAVRKCRM